mmetsp:Transcript_23744/g.62447  ORF Transcript_23744/g.62447 Transcript_23744/m.62447 type:complete len:234 (+) Transcript_23744:542-1243(+)
MSLGTRSKSPSRSGSKPKKTNLQVQRPRFRSDAWSPSDLVPGPLQENFLSGFGTGIFLDKSGFVLAMWPASGLDAPWIPEISWHMPGSSSSSILRGSFRLTSFCVARSLWSLAEVLRGSKCIFAGSATQSTTCRWPWGLRRTGRPREMATDEPLDGSSTQSICPFSRRGVRTKELSYSPQSCQSLPKGSSWEGYASGSSQTVIKDASSEDAVLQDAISSKVCAGSKPNFALSP